MFKLFLVAAGFMLLSTASHAQIICNTYGDMTICSDAQGNTAIINQYGDLTIINPTYAPNYDYTNVPLYKPRYNQYQPRYNRPIAPFSMCATQLQRQVNNCK